MKMVVGLGNPGREYENTRHNIGFIIIDSYAKKNKITNFKNKFDGLYTKVYLNGEYFLLVKPLSFMNLSGNVVRKYANYFKINPKDILVIQDDLDLPVGKIKLKYKGSCGGHNGIRNIIDNLNTEYFPRFKVGIDKNSLIPIKDYVLSEFSLDERKKIDKICDFSRDIIDGFITTDFEKLMSKYNGADYEIN